MHSVPCRMAENLMIRVCRNTSSTSPLTLLENLASEKKYATINICANTKSHALFSSEANECPAQRLRN